jgi:hypothetical protein
MDKQRIDLGSVIKNTKTGGPGSHQELNVTSCLGTFQFPTGTCS